MPTIVGLLSTTLLDYPNKLACSVFLKGCNFRCPYCQNPSLVLSAADYVSPQVYQQITQKYPATVLPEEEFFHFLKRRQGILEGVCVTGGEPTLYGDLPDFLSQIKALGFQVKLDTNGSNPELLASLIASSLVDYVAMDIKAAPCKYPAICQIPAFPEQVNRSVNLLLKGTVPYEFRTTLVKGLHTKQDFEAIACWLQGANAYYLQNFEDHGDLLASACGQKELSSRMQSFSPAELQEILDYFSSILPTTTLRGC